MNSPDVRQQFEQIYEQQIKAIFRFVYFKISDREQAMDITQDTFLRFWNALAAGQAVRNPKAFLFFIAHGLVVDTYRKRRHGADIPLDDVAAGLVFTGQNPADAFDADNAIRAVLAKLRELKKDYQDVVLLHYVDDLRVSEIAEILGKRENAVRVMIHRAIKDLKSKL